MTETGAPLDPVVEQILREGNSEVWKARLRSLPSDRRRTIGIHLLAVAIELARHASDARPAVSDLVELAIALTGPEECKTACAEHAKTIGVEPVLSAPHQAEGRAPGSLDPLAVRALRGSIVRK